MILQVTLTEFSIFLRTVWLYMASWDAVLCGQSTNRKSENAVTGAHYLKITLHISALSSVTLPKLHFLYSVHFFAFCDIYADRLKCCLELTVQVN